MRPGGPVLAALSLAGTLLALEGGMRLRLRTERLAALPHVGLDTEADDRMRWERRTTPGGSDVEVTTNGAGLRGSVEVSPRKSEGTVRVAIFGCSQTFGSGVGDGETYSAQLASLLPGIEVLNFGVGGYGTDQMLLYWESAGVGFEPDVVVLAFAYYHIERNVRGFRFYAKPRFTLGPDGELRLVGVPVRPPEAVLSGASIAAPYPLADRSLLLRWSWAKVLGWQEQQLYRADTAAWQLTRALIVRFAAVARQTGARMVLMNIEPGPPEIIEALAGVADEVAVTYLDVTPLQLAAWARHAHLRLPHDPHWSVEGHRLLAEALHARLCASGVIGGCA